MIAVGKLPAATPHCDGLFATLTVMGAEGVELPAASRDRAVRVCGPFVTARESHGQLVRWRCVLLATVDAVDKELETYNTDIVGRYSRDVNNVADWCIVRGQCDCRGRRRGIGRRDRNLRFG